MLKRISIESLCEMVHKGETILSGDRKVLNGKLYRIASFCINFTLVHEAELRQLLGHCIANHSNHDNFRFNVCA